MAITTIRDVAVAFILLSQGVASSQLHAQSTSNRWAILIRVNDYTELTDLQFCSNDMKALRDQLVA